MSIDFELRDDGVAVITMNRPDQLNALDQAHYQALSEAWMRVRDDKDVNTTDVRAAQVLDGKFRQKLFKPLAAARAIGFGDVEDREDIVLDREAAEDRHLLRQVAERTRLTPTERHPIFVAMDFCEKPGNCFPAARSQAVG